MRELPALFTGPMVRAILEDRKTRTRRLSGLEQINKDPSFWYQAVELKDGTWAFDHEGVGNSASFRCVNTIGLQNGGGFRPRFRRGDRLWVRETFNWAKEENILPGENYKFCPERSGYSSQFVVWRIGSKERHPELGKAIWKPSIFMPRWASRINLEVTDVRCERLQEITEEEARAEGVDAIPVKTLGWKRREILGEPPDMSYRMAFAQLWDSINGKRGYAWSKDPWVWVYEFRRIEG